MKAALIIALGFILLPTCEQRAHAHQDLSALIGRLTAQISTNQNDVDALLQRADLYRLHTNWTAARSDYAAAQKLAPQSVPLLLGVAQLHVDLQEDAAARSAFDAVLSRSPTNWVALFGRAQVLARLGERKAAIADYSRGLAWTAVPRPDQFLERAGLQATEFGAQEAIQGLDEGMARLGWLVTLQQAAIDLELKRHRPDEALTRLETIIARAGRKETWLAWKGEILLAAGKTLEAREVLTATLKAIDGLPPRMRTAPGMTELRAKVERLLSLPVSVAADKGAD
jgi:tetratricopeptide (TPR) repeat protein